MLVFEHVNELRTFFTDCTDCFESGRCVGNILTTAIRDSECDCQTACSDINGCSDFTFDSMNGICNLMLSCDSITECSTCASGPATCPAASTTTTGTTTSPSGSGKIHFGADASQWVMIDNINSLQCAPIVLIRADVVEP